MLQQERALTDWRQEADRYRVERDQALARVWELEQALRELGDVPPEVGVREPRGVVSEGADYPKPCPIPGFENDLYTMGLKLCNDDGTVERDRHGENADYPCTGHAHRFGEHIECTSPVHRRVTA